ncbi:MAG TPA: hypothetical protein VKD47_01715 [Miltoncostaeaceae bacterium]|nr:hypothetical protein [Miltoncostaeaceae bacterium]
MRLIVTDTFTAARTMADRIAPGKARETRVGGVQAMAVEGATIVGLDGPLAEPAGAPPRWHPRRRRVARALGVLAKRSGALVLACDDPLLAAQAREAVGRVDPALARGARAGAPPFDRLGHLDDRGAEARAAELEIGALWAEHVAALDPALGMDECAALLLVDDRARAPSALLRAAGARPEALGRLAERGYVVGEPPELSPAGQIARETLDPALLDPATHRVLRGLADAVRRGATGRAIAVERATAVLAAMPRPAAPEGLDFGRLLGRCPGCGEWMGLDGRRLRCHGCGNAYALPPRADALAVPGAACAACGAPLIRLVVDGRPREPRCADDAKCPTRLARVAGA